MALIAREIDTRHKQVPKTISSIFFGGGTPSLLASEDILSLLRHLSNLGFRIEKNAEITIEVNPGSLEEGKFLEFQDCGINRYSLGVQTFDSVLLKKLGREHTSQHALNDIKCFAKHCLNYSLDLLYSLPDQNLNRFRSDLIQIEQIKPPHLSTYSLNLPKQHSLQTGRAEEAEQIEMYHAIKETCARTGLNHYEISNFARPGFESAHNLCYWQDRPYWGIGLSSHSYFHQTKWGKRFWNPASLGQYRKSLDFDLDSLPKQQVEELQMHQALTDFCHTSLRLREGLIYDAVQSKFGDSIVPLIKRRVDRLVENQLLEKIENRINLTDQGILLSNLVFRELTFNAEDLTLDF